MAAGLSALLLSFVCFVELARGEGWGWWVGWLLATGIFYAAALVINDMLAGQMNADQQVCVLLPWHLAMALALTVGAAVVAAGLAGWRSARIEPSDGLREI